MAPPTLGWDCGTAYDLFLSLHVLHHPDEFGLRGAWAAGVRSRLPSEARDLLQQVHEIVVLTPSWIYTLDEPKDAATALRTLAGMAPTERVRALFVPSALKEEARQSLTWLIAGEVSEEEATHALRALDAPGGKRIPEEKLRSLIGRLARPVEFGDAYLAALQSYYDVFFAEEEARIRPALEEALHNAQELADRLPLPELLEALSQGVRSHKIPEVDELLLVPVFWTTPLIIEEEVAPGRVMFLFGARPPHMSLVPGEVVPDLMLQALKALADPTRLRILRYLSEEPLTPTELAQRLRLRAPTVVHHLHTLRLARLVYLHFEAEGERRYALRQEAVENTMGALRGFLQGDASSPSPSSSVTSRPS